MSSSAAMAEAPALRAFAAALDRGRLAHAVLVQGGRLDALEAAALGLAAKLLETAEPARHPRRRDAEPAGRGAARACSGATVSSSAQAPRPPLMADSAA